MPAVIKRPRKTFLLPSSCTPLIIPYVTVVPAVDQHAPPDPFPHTNQQRGDNTSLLLGLKICNRLAIMAFRIMSPQPTGIVGVLYLQILNLPTFVELTLCVE